MFDELHIEKIERDGEIFIHAADFAQHIAAAATAFILEAKEDGVSDPRDIVYCMGLHTGMMETVKFIGYALMEEDFEKNVKTLDDLINFR